MSDEREEWHAEHWVGWVMAVGATLVVAFFAAFYIAWGDSAGCGETPTVADRATGFHHLGNAALIIGGLWAIAAVASRRFGRMILGGAIGLVPIAAAAVLLRHVDAWHNGLCF